MLSLKIERTEYYDDEKEEFVYTPESTINLEYSLKALSEWESIYHKPFLSNKNMSVEETLMWLRCMTIGERPNDDVYQSLSHIYSKEIVDYVSDVNTATRINSEGSSSREIVTAEVIYFAMVANNIPAEYENWHLNKLITLLRVCAAKNNPPKKMSKSEIMRRNRELNEQRKKQYQTKG